MNDNLTTKVSDGPSPAQPETETPEARSLHRLVRRFADALRSALVTGNSNATVNQRGSDVQIMIPGYVSATIYGRGSTDDPRFTSISAKVGLDGKLLVGGLRESADLKFGVLSGETALEDRVRDK